MKELLNKIHLADCMDLMSQLPDKCIDLAIVDPPYGIRVGIDGRIGIDKAALCTQYKPVKWDDNIPNDLYFKELKRISNNRIIWGVNYFNNLQGGRIVWDKDNTGKFSDCELAYQSFSIVIKKFKYRWNGMLQENMKNKEKRIHPTQKPVALYRWLLQGDIILDTHCGSGSSVIACIEEGFQYIACELDPDYHKASLKRVNKKYRELETGLGLVKHTKRSVQERNKMKELFEE
jgi:site-specific DNA-methyltransferase (adenine-specific)